jgi:hypothetical protein
LAQASNDARPKEQIGFYTNTGGRNKVDAVLDIQSSFSIVAKRLIQISNSWSPTIPASIEDSFGNQYTRVGTVKLTWFRPGRPTTFPVDFAVVEEDLDVMILGRQACQDAEIRRELELFPFGLAPGGAKTKQQKEDEARRKEQQEEEVCKRREEQARAQAASDQQRRIREQQAAQSGPPQSQCNPRQGGYGQQQSGFGSQQSSHI